jgi:DNA-binding NtrC family response regulator
MNRKILLIDDDRDVLDAFKRNLRDSFDVVTALGSAEAVRLLKNSDEFAVVVTDYKMPDMDGLALLTIVKKFSPNSIRVMITGYPEIDMAIDAVNQGNVFRLLTKPYPVSRLIRILNECVEAYNSEIKKLL